jgi:hypothetical protein
MIIQASHMNLGFMHQLQARKDKGASLGSSESALLEASGAGMAGGLSVRNADDATALARLTGQEPGETGAALNPGVLPGVLPDAAPRTIGETVANEVIRRMAPGADENGEPRDAAGLRDSLASTLDWVRDRFGDETATAAAGMVMAATDGTVDEQSLGDGLLDVLRFIDRTQGVAAGDEAIARFNTGINTQLNSYFDNGQSELFYAVESGAVEGGAQATGAGDISARFFSRSTQSAAPAKDAANLTEQLLDSLKQELDSAAGMQDLASRLDAAFDPTQAQPRDQVRVQSRAMTEAAMNAYAGTPLPVASQFMDMPV